MVPLCAALWIPAGRPERPALHLDHPLCMVYYNRPPSSNFAMMTPSTATDSEESRTPPGAQRAVMESVACGACDSTEGDVVRSTPDHLFPTGAVYHVVQCRQCGLCYSNPRPDTDSMGAFYPPAYTALRQRILKKSVKNPVALAIMKQARRRRIPPGGPGRVVDVGCGTGIYLDGMREAGWEVQGVEPDSDAARIAREQFDIPVVVGPAEEALRSLPDASFDAATLWHVLEHVFEPSDVLQEIRRVLKPEGALLIEVPNYGSLVSRIFGNCWFPLELPRHTFQFTRASLTSILDRNGFAVQQWRWIASPVTLHWSLRILWRRLRGHVRPLPLTMSPLKLVLLLPVCILLALFRTSGFIALTAVRKPDCPTDEAG